LSQVHEAAVAAGRDPAALETTAYVFGAIGRRAGEAEALLDPILRGIFGAGLDRTGDACLVGTPDRWVELIGRFGEAGAQTVNFLLFSADLRADLELVLSDVVPHLTGRAPLAVV
jgi:alkanesulfonate monooxygenase SsuD/methylene tetrahydromethanopterin reductase-like flavin-dependent oxidoreductase (luciferase family)